MTKIKGIFNVLVMALFALFRTSHGTAWHQLRFYHDPLLDRLEEAGLVDRVRDRADRRFVTARITSTGREKLAALRSIFT